MLLNIYDAGAVIRKDRWVESQHDAVQPVPGKNIHFNIFTIIAFSDAIFKINLDHLVKKPVAELIEFFEAARVVFLHIKENGGIHGSKHAADTVKGDEDFMYGIFGQFPVYNAIALAFFHHCAEYACN